MVEREKIVTAKKAAEANTAVKGEISELKTTLVSKEDDLREESKY